MVYSDKSKDSQSYSRKKVRLSDILALKNVRPISSITCYDATFARLIEKTPLDIVLVGDSLGHVIQGKNSTIGVTLEDVVYHTKCVAAALKTPLLCSDMPFATAGFSESGTFQAAEKLLRAGAESVKIEGATPEICAHISRLTRHGIPVIGHIGLVPQSIHTLSGYKTQGKDDAGRKRLVAESLALQDAGCFAIVLELVAADSAAAVTHAVKIPTIGIGSGKGCDGQILVLQDMLGCNSDFKPKFLKHFATLENTVVKALEAYHAEVCERTFPE